MVESYGWRQDDNESKGSSKRYSGVRYRIRDPHSKHNFFESVAEADTRCYERDGSEADVGQFGQVPG